MMSDLGISIMAWNRPDYLRQCLESLAANDLTDVDVHLWQDGAKCHITGKRLTSPKLIEASVATFMAAPLLSKTVHRQGQNMGCAAMRAIRMPWMAEHYERFICLDDDVIFSPHYVVLTRRLLDQFEHDSRVASISPGFHLLCQLEQWGEYLDAVRFVECHVWAEAYWREKWARIEPWYMTYYDIIASFPYHRHQAYKRQVVEWARGLGAREQESSDTALIRGGELAGMQRLRLIVNRATGIGDVGLHCTAALMAQMGVGHQPIYASPKELDIQRFRVVGDVL